MSNLNKQEQSLEGFVPVEVSNPSSYYFGESLYVLSKAEAIGETWFKAWLDYQPSLVPNVQVWFRESELEINQGECY